MTTPPPARPRSRRARRVVPVALLAGCAFIVGAAVGADGSAPQRETADRYAAAWAREDWAAMHALLATEAQERYPLEAFADAHERAARTATSTSLRPAAAASVDDDVAEVPVTVRTRAFGTVRTTLRLPISEQGDARRVAWAPHLSFPGVDAGEELSRRTKLPARADILSRAGTTLAAGEDRSSELAATRPDVAALVGALGPIPKARQNALRALGVPADAQIGVSGLERALDEQLIGQPGGTLRAGGRVLARTEPRGVQGIRSSIDLDVQNAAAEGLAGRYGGVAVLRPASGEILALAGIALDGLQPPGSTFKIITLTAGLEAGKTSVDKTYPVQTETTLEGVALENANGESCGGSLATSFALSCNSVFAPLGAEAGATALVRAAEQFGFNADVGIPGAAISTLPAAGDIGDDLAVGSTAIGQGRVQATALMMAWTSATIANRGLRPRLTLEVNAEPRTTRAVPEKVAATVGRLMREVVKRGTGVLARIDGVAVAGKTGTAELRQTQGDCEPAPAPAPGEVALPETCAEGQNDPSDTTAWFTAFAPATKPRVAVAVVLPGSGAGGDTAAPVARQVLVAALKRGPQS